MCPERVKRVEGSFVAIQAIAARRNRAPYAFLASFSGCHPQASSAWGCGRLSPSPALRVWRRARPASPPLFLTRFLCLLWLALSLPWPLQLTTND